MARIDEVVKELVKNVKILRTPKPVVHPPIKESVTYPKIKSPE